MGVGGAAGHIGGGTQARTADRALPGDEVQLERCHLRLLDAQVCVDTSISRSPGEVLVFSIRDVLFRSCISILLGQAKVNDK